MIDLALLVLAPLIVLVAFYSNADRALPYWSAAVLSALLLYYFFSLRSRSGADKELQITEARMSVGIGFFVLGVALLYGGGELVLHAALNIANRLQISEEIIGLTIVAVGTSIPDVTASIVATRKKEFGIATGNLLGSNISNILLVLNGTILVSGQSLATLPTGRLDYALVGLTSGVCFVAAWKTQTIPKTVGLSLLVIYLAYISYRVGTVVLESQAATTFVALGV
jgi:cation:H+ antiporter